MDTSFFLNPLHPMQKKYEALRASYTENINDKDIAKRFGFTYYSFKSIKRDYKNATADDFFSVVKKGPKGHHQATMDSKNRIIELRKKNYSIPEIEEKLYSENIIISCITIEKILYEEGFAKLFRRTNRERLIALQSDKKYPEYSNVKLFGNVDKTTTSFGGIFLFLPIIYDLKLYELFNIQDFHGTEEIPSISYLLSYLCLKLLGKERLSHINDFSFDHGLGTFAGLNVLPKSASISKYSYKHPRSLVQKMLKGFVKLLHSRGYIKGKNINLDFHSIPYYGEQSNLETHWVPTKGRRFTSILSFFAQDLDTTYLCYSNGDIKNNESNDEILEFIKFYKSTTGILPERLVFDSKLTTYENLNKVDEQNILFVTLKRRGKNFGRDVKQLTGWKNIILDNVKRKYRNLEFIEREVNIKEIKKKLRWIIIKGNGRELPMSLITNDFESSVKQIITLYSHRWRIENNIQENVDFFNLNSLSSDVIVKVDFDIAITLIANSLYKIFAEKTKWFKDAKPKMLSRNFIDNKANITIDNEKVTIKFHEKSYNPVIMDWLKSLNEIKIPWWNNRFIDFQF